MNFHKFTFQQVYLSNKILDNNYLFFETIFWTVSRVDEYFFLNSFIIDLIFLFNESTLFLAYVQSLLFIIDLIENNNFSKRSFLIVTKDTLN